MNRYYIVKDSHGNIMGVYDSYAKAATRKIIGNSGWTITEWKK